MPFPVIPANAGIQLGHVVENILDPGFHRVTDFWQVDRGI
jgi:hypothetical protein